MIEKVKNKCNKLKLRAFLENLEQSLETASKNNWPALVTIDHLLQLELELRNKNRIQRCFKQSGLYETPTIDQFDFDHHGSRKKQKNKILDLLTLEFIQERKDIIFIGNPGVGNYVKLLLM